jgi:antitoxin component of MazEF toxin-antitoxin module
VRLLRRDQRRSLPANLIHSGRKPQDRLAESFSGCSLAGMGNRALVRIDKTWLQTLGAMIDGDAKIQVQCTKCRRFKRFSRDDLVTLAERVGLGYSLINRRCRCRLTEGCDGWNRFYFLMGIYRPLWDEEYGWTWRD